MSLLMFCQLIFACECFCACEIFRKKRLKIALITSFAYTTDNKSASSVNELRYRMFTKKNSSIYRLTPTLDALVRWFYYFIHICLIFSLNSSSSIIKNIKYNIEKRFSTHKISLYIKQFFPYDKNFSK